MAAKSAIEAAQEFAQATLSAAPVIILGSGASAAHGVPGMGQLAEHLVQISPDSTWAEHERAEWDKLQAELSAGADLESALQSVRLADHQTQLVAAETRAFLLPADLAALKAILFDRRALPLSRLYRYLFDSTHRQIHVVTPNYDRLAEYAADAVELNTFTGFSYGHLQSRAKHHNTRIFVGGRETRTVLVWKVHGSLDWFQNEDSHIIGLRSQLEIPSTYSPLMITPGIDKYRLTHGEPFRTILACSDSALENARAYLCIGYGFNDEHVQTKLIERCEQNSVPLIVVTKELSSIAKGLLGRRRIPRYLAIEEGPIGSRVYINDADGFDYSKAIWQLDEFLDFAIGSFA